jgi:hypothetical protein
VEGGEESFDQTSLASYQLREREKKNKPSKLVGGILGRNMMIELVR